MGTPHNEAEKGEIAKRVLMPGDPLRAKYIAEHFLKDAVCRNLQGKRDFCYGRRYGSSVGRNLYL